MLVNNYTQDSDVPIVDIAPDQSKHEARQWISTYRHLQTRAQAVAAELGSGPACEALRGKEFSAAASAASSVALQRLQAAVWCQVDGARKGVRQISTLLSNVRPGSTPPIEELAAAIDVAERTIGNAREEQRVALEALYQEEAQLEADIEAISSRLDAEIAAESARAVGQRADQPAGPSQGARARAASAGPRRPASCPRQRRVSSGGGGGGGAAGKSNGKSSGDGGGGGLAPEVQEYEDFVALHGPTGGWDPEDHEEFLSILRACDGDYAHAVTLVLERTIGYTRADVVAHARWHMELADLEVRKRLALERWRREKQARKAALAAQHAALHSDTAELAERERERDQRSREEEAMLVEAKKALAARWRAEREERQRAEAEAARQRAEAAEAARRAEWEARQAANKQKLQMVKEAKERQRREEQRRAAAEAAIKAALAAPDPEARHRVAERNQATFARRQSLLAQQEVEKSRRERVQQQILEKVHVEAPADPRRLLKGTAAHMQRVEAQRAEERRPRDSGFILHVGGRVTPSWRAGLT